MTRRPGTEVARRWPALVSFRLGNWRGADCRMLADATELSAVHLEGRGQPVSLDGVQTCPELRSLTVLTASVAGLEPLAGLSRLQELRLTTRRNAPHSPLDLSALRGTSLERFWVSHATGLHALEALREIPTLRELRLIDSVLPEGAQGILDELGRRMRVEVVSRGRLVPGTSPSLLR